MLCRRIVELEAERVGDRKMTRDRMLFAALGCYEARRWRKEKLVCEGGFLFAPSCIGSLELSSSTCEGFARALRMAPKKTLQTEADYDGTAKIIHVRKKS